MQEKRGSPFNRILDRWLGGLLLLLLDVMLIFRRSFKHRTSPNNESILIVCFGAIGDLILLSEALRASVGQKRIYLACSKLNYGVTELYNDVYSGTAVVELRDPLSLYRIAQRFGIGKIFDSTQWANIGPIQVAMAELLSKNLTTTGFETRSTIRNRAYGSVVPHGRHIHEVLNFSNLLSGACVFDSNRQIPALITWLYQQRPMRGSRKLLFHMWPSGNRSCLKAWPVHYWCELIECCRGLGDTIYLSGGPGDIEKTERFIESLGVEGVINIAGRYTLAELSRFISNEIELVVSVNTGILHLAASTGVPVIGLHGGVHPDRWGPLNDQSVSLIPQSGKYGYLHYGFEYPKNDADAYVLDKLPVSQVRETIETQRAGR